MHATLSRPAPRHGYTLIEVLVAMGILSMGIAAASRLSLSQNMTEEINQRRSIAVNQAECAARLWQLKPATAPADLLLNGRNSDNSLMTVSITDPPGTLSGGEDFGVNPVVTESVTVSVTWTPLTSNGGTGTGTISLPALRLVTDRR